MDRVRNSSRQARCLEARDLNRHKEIDVKHVKAVSVVKAASGLSDIAGAIQDAIDQVLGIFKK